MLARWMGMDWLKVMGWFKHLLLKLTNRTSKVMMINNSHNKMMVSSRNKLWLRNPS